MFVSKMESIIWTREIKKILQTFKQSNPNILLQPVYINYFLNVA